jgi:hypothetical protein
MNQCLPFTHEWSKWNKIAEGILYMQYDVLTGRKLDDHEKYINGYFENQRRECGRCGLAQLRKIRT